MRKPTLRRIATGLAALLIPAAAAAQDVGFPGDYFGRVDLPLPQAFSNLKRLIGDADNFEPITGFSANNRYRVMSTPIGRLDLLVEKDGKKEVFLCTGWLIAADLILTNHHCVPGKEGTLLKSQLVMNYLEEGKAGAVDVYPVDIAPVETNAELDYSVVRVRGEPGAKYGIIPLKARDPDPNEELFVIQHPAGTPKRLTRRNCRAAQSAERPEELNHFCDTLGGSSGSPVFSDNDMALVGLHFAGIEKKVNFAKRMTVILERSRVLGQLRPGGEAPPPAAAQGSGTPPAGAGSGATRPPAEATPAAPRPQPGPASGGLRPLF